jgi:hypothetical protein
MVSLWWVVLAFLMGGLAGVLVVSLFGMAAREDERAVAMERTARRTGRGAVKLHEGWIAEDAAGRTYSGRTYVFRAHAR